MNSKKLNLKAKHKIKNKISWLFFSALNLLLSYLPTYLPIIMYNLPSYIYIFQNIINMPCGKKNIVSHVTILNKH